MKKITIFTAIFSIALISVGCTEQEKLTQSYFMQHPKLLKAEVTHCQSLESKTPEQTIFCETALSAATSFMAIVDEQQSDPEKFGKKILDAETNCAQALEVAQQTQQAVSDLQAKGISGAQLENAQSKFKQAQTDYAAKQEQIKILMAVMSLSSPE